MIRLASIPFLIGLTLADNRYGVALLFLLAFCTDALDGFIGRTFRIVTNRLSKLDSVADMSLLGTGLIAFSYFNLAFVVSHWLSLTVVLLFYIGQITLAYLRYGKASSFHTLAARFAAVVQTIFITYSLFYEPKLTFYYFTVVVSLFETSEEIILILMHRRYPGKVFSFFYLLYIRFFTNRRVQHNDQPNGQK